MSDDKKPAEQPQKPQKPEAPKFPTDRIEKGEDPRPKIIRKKDD